MKDIITVQTVVNAPMERVWNHVENHTSLPYLKSVS
jgi:ligand-binding SRPBCC domain-containing protein